MASFGEISTFSLKLVILVDLGYFLHFLAPRRGTLIWARNNKAKFMLLGASGVEKCDFGAIAVKTAILREIT